MVDLDDVARSLLTLEIDTIVSDGITAARMPSDGQALIRIAQLFKDFLDRVIDEVERAGSEVADLPPFVDADGGATAFGSWTVLSGGMRTFTTLRTAAEGCKAARDAVRSGQDVQDGLRPEHDPILARVAAACGDILALLRRLGLTTADVTATNVELSEEVGGDWPKFDRDTLLTLRRIWETGVDVVVMQTTVRLDGGVTTRVLDGWDGPGATALHELHYRGVDVALGRWAFLAKTASDFAGFFFPGEAGRTRGAAEAGRTLVR